MAAGCAVEDGVAVGTGMALLVLVLVSGLVPVLMFGCRAGVDGDEYGGGGALSSDDELGADIVGIVGRNGDSSTSFRLSFSATTNTLQPSAVSSCLVNARYWCWSFSFASLSLSLSCYAESIFRWRSLALSSQALPFVFAIIHPHQLATFIYLSIPP